MAKIAFILLCHKDPDAIIEQAERLTAAGDYISIHFDASASAAAFMQIKSALKDNDNVVFSKKRVRCGWGEWSLVQATLYALSSALNKFEDATHCYMLSGDCMAIKSSTYIHKFLYEHDVDFIESFDFFESNWIKTGMKGDRLHYRHFFNERNQQNLFYKSFQFQKKYGLKREVPADLQMMIGSQWWCLRRETAEKIVEFTRLRRDIVRFFKTTWIPDETYFQTLVRHLVPEDQIDSRTLTFLMFSDYGMPVTFYDDHYDLLLSQDFLFARKISPHAHQLKEQLGQLFVSDKVDYEFSNEGRTLFRFLTGRGRVGRRFAPRFWERQAVLGRQSRILILLCKKWHVAKRLTERIKSNTGVSCFEYLFDEAETSMPVLGGIETSLAKRTRHRRAFLRLLFEHENTDQMVICLDPSNIELLRDLFDGHGETRLLEISCDFTDAYLVGHARRIGLAGDKTPQRTIETLLPTLRETLQYEIDQIRDAEFPQSFRLKEGAPRTENAEQLASFLKIEPAAAEDILSIDYLYSD